MGEVKKINIKSEHYVFDGMIAIRNFHSRNFYSNLLKIDKKSHADINIYYIGYITIKKFSDCENIQGVNPLSLIIHSATGHSKEKKWRKILNY